MASTDQLAFPVSGAPYRLSFVIKSSGDGNPITGGLTNLSAAGNSQISQDGGPFVNTTNAPVEIGVSGYGYLDLTAAEMTCTGAIVRITSTNTNHIEFQHVILTSALPQLAGVIGTPPTPSGIAAAVWSYPDEGSAVGRQGAKGPMLDQIYRYLFNAQRVDKMSQTQTLYGDDGLTPLLTGAVSANSQVTVRGKLA